jgi:hypothetical protein
MTRQRDFIAHQVTSLRIVVLLLAVKNFLPKADPPPRFHVGCRKIGHSRYNSASSRVEHGPYRVRVSRTAYAGCNGFGFPHGFTAYDSMICDHSVVAYENFEIPLILPHARTA